MHGQAELSLKGFPTLWTQLIFSSLALNAMEKDPVSTQTALKLEETTTGLAVVLPP